MTFEQEIKDALKQHRGKLFSVSFIKKNGDKREMLARQGVKAGASPLKGGKWANGFADPKDYDLLLVTDIQLEKAGKHSRRSVKLSSIVRAKIGGKEFIRENQLTTN